jgi:Uma2 family endonuclease
VLTAHRKLTYQDYLGFPDDGLRHELLDGEHYVSSAPSRKHQAASRRLCTRFDNFLERTGLGEVFPAPFEVNLSEHDVVQPDLLFISSERASILTEVNVLGAPDLVVEILSESTRRADQIVKRRRYELFGVREYWILDPVLRTASVYRLSQGRFAPPEELSAEVGDILSTPLLPGLAIPLTEIFI